MKKILGISLCALFAVSAANANIASSDWVTQQIGNIDLSGIEANEGAITALTGRVGVNEGKIAQNETDITALEGTVAGHTTSITGINNSMNTLSGKVTANEGNIATNKTNIDTNTEAIAALQESVTGLGDLAHEDMVTTNFITDGTIMNADISDTAKIAMNKIDFSSEQTGAIDSGIDSVKVGQIATNEGNIAALQGNVAGLKALARKDTVATADIDDSAVTTEKIANDAVTSAKIDDLTITNDDIAGNAQIASTKIAFSDTQTKVFNSGITGDLVGQITTNMNDISSTGTQVSANKADITGLKERMDTAETKIGNIQTTVNNNTNAINANKAAIDAMLSQADGYDICKDSTYGCTLVVKGGSFLWEAVSRSTTTGN